MSPLLFLVFYGTLMLALGVLLGGYACYVSAKTISDRYDQSLRKAIQDIRQREKAQTEAYMAARGNKERYVGVRL
jgi:hypothetical protein